MSIVTILLVGVYYGHFDYYERVAKSRILSQIYRGKTVEARSVLYPLWQ